MGTSGIIARSIRQVKSHSRRVFLPQTSPPTRYASFQTQTPTETMVGFLGVILASAFGHKSRVKPACFQTWNKYPRARVTTTTLNVHFPDGPSCDADFFDSKSTGGYETARPHWFDLPLPGLNAGSCNAGRKTTILYRPCDAEVSGMPDSVFLVSPLQI